jgi:septal ring factor EnvC (AmiA/AmiB activator)
LNKGRRRPKLSLVLCAAVFVLNAGNVHPSPRSIAAQKLALAEQLRAERERDRANAAHNLQMAQAEALKLGEKRLQAASALRQAEQEVADAAGRLRQAQSDQAQAEARLRQRAATFAALVPLMLRMSRYPAETVLAVPAPPDQALEGLFLTSGIAATLNRDAAELRAQAAHAAQLRAATERQESVLAAERERKAALSAALEAAMAQTQEKISAALVEGQKAAELVASLAAQANSLRDAIAAMDAARAQAEAQAAREAAEAERNRHTEAAASARARQAALGRPVLKGGMGRLVPPVSAPIVRVFGAPAVDGPATGITYAPGDNTFVSSPCNGRVAFAAPFRSYGQLIILECGGGMDIVLAGLGHIDTAPGRPVRAGEPVGHMPGSGKTGLYVEFRSHGQPVNPAPFLNARG